MNKPRLLSQRDLESWRAICRDGLLGSQSSLTLAAGLVHALSHIEALEADAARYRWLTGRLAQAEALLRDHGEGKVYGIREWIAATQAFLAASGEQS